ncbi:MAG: DUF222 domain-containing protein [Nocardioides sp.]
MTVVVDRSPVRGLDSTGALLAGVHALLDAHSDEAVTSSRSGYALLVAETERAIRRLQAIKLRVLAAADSADVSADAGLADTGAWLAKQTRAGSAAAAGQVALANDLQSLPATATALRGGGVSVEHATVIAHTIRRLPETLTPRQRRRVEAKLVALAGLLDPPTLRRRARMVLHDITTRAEAEQHHADALRAEERRALAKTRLTLHDNSDGTTTGHFTVPTLAGDILRKVLQQMTSPRRLTGKTAGRTSNDRPDHAHAQGLAFVELLEHLPTDRLHGKVAATVVVTLQHRQLAADLAAAGLDTGAEVSPGEARRLACGAGILPAILNGSSLPLDLGRTQRFFTEAQRTALATRHTTCAAEGCDRPYAWCELHHQQPWHRGGNTDLADAVPLCGWHHRRIHDPGYTHQRQPGGQMTIHRRC